MTISSTKHHPICQPSRTSNTSPSHLPPKRSGTKTRACVALWKRAPLVLLAIPRAILHSLLLLQLFQAFCKLAIIVALLHLSFPAARPQSRLSGCDSALAASDLPQRILPSPLVIVIAHILNWIVPFFVHLLMSLNRALPTRPNYPPPTQPPHNLTSTQR